MRSYFCIYCDRPVHGDVDAFLSHLEQVHGIVPILFQPGCSMEHSSVLMSSGTPWQLVGDTWSGFYPVGLATAREPV